jgi:urocanate hydratase
MGGVSRRSWARNKNAIERTIEWNEKHKNEGQITIPFLVDDDILKNLVGDRR